MYNIEIFEQFTKSNLTSEEVYKKIIEIHPIQIETMKKYHLPSILVVLEKTI